MSSAHLLPSNISHLQAAVITGAENQEFILGSPLGMNAVTERLIVSSELLIDSAPGLLYKTYGTRAKQLARTGHGGIRQLFAKKDQR